MSTAADGHRFRHDGHILLQTRHDILAFGMQMADETRRRIPVELSGLRSGLRDRLERETGWHAEA